MKKRRASNDPVSVLESRWPGKRPKKIENAFIRLKDIFKKRTQVLNSQSRATNSVPRHTVSGPSFNILDVARRTCMKHDFLFLSRQLTYHIAATADLPQALGNEAQIEAVVSELVGHIARRAPHGGRIQIGIKETMWRQCPGIEISFRGVDYHIADLNRSTFLKQVLEGGVSDFSPILACREAITKAGGRFIADLPEPQCPIFRIILPTVEVSAVAMGENNLYKYDIAIKNIASVRKRFGIKKSSSLVSQVEEFVRSLVRHPIDIVMAVHDKGTVTAIYETQKGAAESVASRISARLGLEKFQIGKKVVDLDFRYHLSALPSAPIRCAEATKPMHR